MKKQRKKIAIQALERKLEKIQRRIERLAENAYIIRQAMLILQKTEAVPTADSTASIGENVQEAAVAAGNELETLTIPQEG